MPDEFTFTHHSPLTYMGYVDLATGRALAPEPGGSYAMRAVDEGLPVPPDDGRWDPPYVRPGPAAEKQPDAEGAESGAAGQPEDRPAGRRTRRSAGSTPEGGDAA